MAHDQTFCVELCLFVERDNGREWLDDWYTLGEFESYDDAFNYARMTAESKRDCVEFVIDMLDADGASVDVKERGPNPNIYSIEVVAGWPLDYWIHEECHEARED